MSATSARRARSSAPASRRCEPALELLLADRVLVLLLLLAQHLEPLLPSLGPRQPQPSRLAYLLFGHVRRDTLAEHVVVVDHATGDLERRRGKSRRS